MCVGPSCVGCPTFTWVVSYGSLGVIYSFSCVWFSEKRWKELVWVVGLRLRSWLMMASGLTFALSVEGIAEMVDWTHRARVMKLYDEGGIEIVNQELHPEEYESIIQTLKFLELVE